MVSYEYENVICTENSVFPQGKYLLLHRMYDWPYSKLFQLEIACPSERHSCWGCLLLDPRTEALQRTRPHGHGQHSSLTTFPRGQHGGSYLLHSGSRRSNSVQRGLGDMDPLYAVECTQLVGSVPTSGQSRSPSANLGVEVASKTVQRYSSVGGGLVGRVRVVTQRPSTGAGGGYVQDGGGVAQGSAEGWWAGGELSPSAHRLNQGQYMVSAHTARRRTT